MKKKRIADGQGAWIDARTRHHLSHAKVQMARDLGMNPKKLGSLDNHRREHWQLPLPVFIEELYQKRFGRAQPEFGLSIEERARRQERKKARGATAKLERRQAALPEVTPAVDKAHHPEEAYRDRTVAVDMDPLSLVCRLATNVSPPPAVEPDHTGPLGGYRPWSS
ncbi:MAG: hypothetical protein JJE39_02000 [Vicinamibacteria bacterium]|nr:hypothetical protein [Vicinamibacteria bacterium]